MNKLYLFCIALVCNCQQSFTQTTDSLHVITTPVKEYKTSAVRLKNLIVPAAFLTYGVIASQKGALRNMDISIRDKWVGGHPSFRTHVDDYLQYTPAAAVFALSGFGVQGAHTIKQQVLLYAMSYALSAGFVLPAKQIAHKQRPDGSGFESFPSGHTATAFVSAEFLRREYRDVSPWIGVAGYLAATSTGVLRVLNNKHWAGDVVAGAGVGIGATNIAYWLYDKIKERRHKIPNAVFMPYYQDKTMGMAFVKNLW